MEISYRRQDLSPDELIDLYKAMLFPRMIEEKMLILLRQGRISKWFSGIGQEAIAASVAYALRADEYILPMHRNLGVFTGRNVPLERLFGQFQGKSSGFTKGRDRSFHFGSNEHHIVGMISHLGPQLALADGIALAQKVRGTGKVTAVFTGEGGTSEGDFHEALNVASVWDLPVLFIIENNGYGLSTPTHEQYRAERLSDRAKGYGMEGYTIDGNNVLEVYSTIKRLTAEMRENPKPVLLECMTFRRRGHEEASGTKYVPKELMEHWEKLDPVDNYRDFLISEGLVTPEDRERFRDEFRVQIDRALEIAFAEDEVISTPEAELADVYRAFDAPTIAPQGAKREMRLIDAVHEGLHEAMTRYPELIIMGQDIAEYGGVFKATEGFLEEFGRDRVRNTPICESAILAAGLGLSVAGMKSIVEMQFADFVSSGFNNIVNNLAKVHYRWGQNADVVVRMPTGAGVNAGPFHSQSNEAWFTHVPGLKIVYPAFPDAAKGLLLRSVEDPNPVMFFEHKALYRSLYGEVPEGHYTYNIGEAALRADGDELVIITYGQGVHWALKVAQEVGQGQIAVLDLQTLVPLDWDNVFRSVRSTGKVLVLHEDTLFGGIGGEIAARISEDCFMNLDAPVRRLGSLDTPVPFAKSLEESFLPLSELKKCVEELLAY
ncbi:dehydrogenase [Cryomorphaceae bacterium]|nr:dehydrogenase [Cryomorphaceae bacterium]